MIRKFCGECFIELKQYNNLGLCSHCFIRLRKLNKPNKKNKRLKKPCSRCGNYFTPTGPYHRVCFDCNLSKSRGIKHSKVVVVKDKGKKGNMVNEN